MSLILRLAALLWLALLAQTAQAACTAPASATTDLGQRTSYDVRTGGLPAVAAPAMLNCGTGSLLSLMPADYTRASVTSANGFKLRSAAGEVIAYRLSADSAGTQTFAQGTTVDYLSPSILSLLGILGSQSLVPTMYAALTDTPNVAAGTYTDTVTVNWSWSICRAIGVGLGGIQICVQPETGTATTTMTVTVTVTKDCRISAPPVAFGSAPLASRFASVTQAVAIDCTKGAGFTVSFTAGTSGASRPWRAMKDGAGHLLRYNLYWLDGSTIWDDQSPRASASAGTGATTPTLLQTYVARVDPTQATPPAGSYTDTVSVVVIF